LPLPDLHPLLVDDALQRVDVGGAEAAEEVASGGGVGDARDSQGVEVGLVGAESFEVLQARAARQDVVGEVEDVAGLEVRQVALEETQFAVDGVGQAELSHQEMEGAEAAGVQTAGLVADLVVDVGVAEQAAALLRPLPRAQPAPDAALAIVQPPAYCGLHGNYLPAWGEGCRCIGPVSAHGGDAPACDRPRARRRARLRRMTHLRLGHRVDPSDAVPETLAQASRPEHTPVDYSPTRTRETAIAPTAPCPAHPFGDNDRREKTSPGRTTSARFTLFP